MPGKAPRRKGDAYERECRDQLAELGVETLKVPSSGSGADFKGDLHLKMPHGRTWVAECKIRRTLTLYNWLGTNDAVLCRSNATPGQDKPPTLVVCTLETFMEGRR